MPIAGAGAARSLGGKLWLRLFLSKSFDGTESRQAATSVCFPSELRQTRLELLILSHKAIPQWHNHLLQLSRLKLGRPALGMSLAIANVLSGTYSWASRL
jgi:hypothetical protein